MLCCAVLLIILKEKRGASCCLSYSGSHRLRLLPRQRLIAPCSRLDFTCDSQRLGGVVSYHEEHRPERPEKKLERRVKRVEHSFRRHVNMVVRSESTVLIFRRAWRRESNVKRGSTGKVSGVTVLSGWRTALLARCRANLRCCIIYLRARSFVCDSSVAFLPYLKMQPLLRANPRCYLHFASCHSVPTALPMRALYCEYSYHERKPKSTWFFFVCSLSNFSLSLLFPSGLD